MEDQKDHRILIKAVMVRFARKLRAEGRSPRTVDFYFDKFEHFLRFCAAHHIQYMEELTPDLVRTWLIELQRDHNPGGQHAIFRAARALVYWYEAEFEPPDFRNPIRHKVKAPKVPEKLLDPVEIDVVEALMATCRLDGPTGLRDRAVLRLLLSSGMRAGELLALNVEDVNMMLRTGRVMSAKGGNSREIYFNKETRHDLRLYVRLRGATHGPLFWSHRERKRMSYSALRSMLRRRSALAGLDQAPTAHMFRRAFAKGRLKANVDLITLMRLMGHKSLEATKCYLKLNNDDLQEAHDQE